MISSSYNSPFIKANQLAYLLLIIRVNRFQNTPDVKPEGMMPVSSLQAQQRTPKTMILLAD
jgi:hypothetical protein